MTGGALTSGAGAADRADKEDALEYGRWLFAQECRFVAGAATEGALPPAAGVEAAFAGRSNVGKPSLINALTGRRALARTSRAPGRTQQLNFFDLGGRLMLVDLPGYGFARAAKSRIKGWTQLIHAYLRGRATLRRLCLLIDARHGLKDSDRDIMALLDTAAVSYQIVLTKVDKISAAELADVTASVGADMAAHPACYPEVLATSAREHTGIPELRAILAGLAEGPGGRTRTGPPTASE